MNIENLQDWIDMPLGDIHQNLWADILRVPNGWVVTYTRLTKPVGLFVPEPKFQPDPYWIKGEELAELRRNRPDVPIGKYMGQQTTPLYTYEDPTAKLP